MPNRIIQSGAASGFITFAYAWSDNAHGLDPVPTKNSIYGSISTLSTVLAQQMRRNWFISDMTWPASEDEAREANKIKVRIL
jgi:hypothetical protein